MKWSIHLGRIFGIDVFLHATFLLLLGVIAIAHGLAHGSLADVFGVIGLFSNPFLLLIAILVWIGAAQEAAATDLKAAIGGRRDREAMLTDFRTLRADGPLDGALFQADPRATVLPIVRDGRLVSLITAENIGELMMIRAARANRGVAPPPLPRESRLPFMTHR